MKELLGLLLIITALHLFGCGTRAVKSTDGNKPLTSRDSTVNSTNIESLGNIHSTVIPRLEIPQTTSQDLIISHTGYTFLYSEQYEQAKWVAYELTSEETRKTNERTNKFIVDTKVKTGSANDRDYAGSGYDKGHLAPAGDMSWSATTMSESFYYSNMSPQFPGFNRGIWKRLEELVRTWAIENESVYVVTGPVLTEGLPTIGANKVSVPKFFYKVIFDYTELELKGIGFILPNKGSQDPLQTYAVTIDSVEQVTGLDFFPQLHDEQETTIESTLTLQSWLWKSTSMGATNQKEITNSLVQCKGLTKSGLRCKNKTRNESGYCYLNEH